MLQRFDTTIEIVEVAAVEGQYELFNACFGLGGGDVLVHSKAVGTDVDLDL